MDATRAKQLEAWRSLLLSWHAQRKSTSLVVREWPLWENAALGRRLPDEGIRAVLEHCVAAGSAAWEDGARTRATILYRSALEWGRDVHAWAAAHGMAADGAIFTVYELRTADEWAGNDFCALEPALLVRALEALEREGLATLVRESAAAADADANAATAAATMDEVGVKFRER